jgi:hypothetical protein
MALLRPKPTEPLNGSEAFEGTDATVLDFWRWALSDLRMNTIRPMVAEFLVKLAVGDRSPFRIEWSDHDVTSADGIRIEVKSSGYCQSWAQKSLSKIQFGRFAGRSWDPETGSYGVEQVVRADVFVFAVQTCLDPQRYDALSVEQWEFYVLPGSVFLENPQRAASLGLVQRLAGHPVSWGELHDAVKKVHQAQRTAGA